MSNSPGIRQVYEQRRAALERESGELARRSGTLSAIRGVTFLLTLGLLGYGIFSELPTAGWAVAGFAGAVFVGLVVHHARIAARETHQEEQLELLLQGRLRLEHLVASDADGGARFAELHHPFAGDLDIFGSRPAPRGKKQEPPAPQAPVSLFQLVNTAQTSHGRKLVASWLANHAPPAEVRRRQQAARELSTDHPFRLELAGHGLYAKSTEVADDPLLDWAEAEPARFDPKLTALSKLLVPLTLGLLVASQVIPDAPTLLARAWLAPVTVQMIMLLALRQSVGAMVVKVTSRESPFGRFRALLAHIESAEWESESLQALSQRVRAGGEGKSNSAARASEELAKLERIISFADLRHNTLIHLMANLLLLWDLWCALALERWRVRCGKQVRGWLDATGEVEALSSLATFAVEHPDFEWPEVSDGETLFVADRLGHPLIPTAERVCNDVSLPGPGRALLVTGSNMSGKSTLLRAMGVNAVLAQAGAPVCASGLRMSALSVWTSMRISDALERKISHFYAELERLKAILDAAKPGHRLLFLLDEILHGTNSRERHVGAKRVVLHLTESGCVGAVSSHDVELAELEPESEGHVVNVHFAEQVKNDVMSFDYRLQKGVVQTRNALRLMRELGFPLQASDVPTSVSGADSSAPPEPVSEFFGNRSEGDN